MNRGQFNSCPLFIMKIILYKNYSQNNILKKNVEQIAELEGNITNELDLMHTFLVLNYGEIDFNYVYIPLFKRYYFVDEIKAIKNSLYSITLKIDVLYTYRELILNSQIHATKGKINNYYINNDYEFEIREENRQQEIPIKLNNDGKIIMII